LPPRFACLATMRLPDELNLLIPYDVAVGVYLGLFCMLMERASPEDAAEIAWRGEPINRRVSADLFLRRPQCLCSGGDFRPTIHSRRRFPKRHQCRRQRSTRRFATRKYAYFIISEWLSYCLLAYGPPSVPQQPGNSLRISFNSVQNIEGKWRLFLARSRSRPR